MTYCMWIKWGDSCVSLLKVSESAILAGIVLFLVSMETNGTICNLFFHCRDKIRRKAEKVTMI